MRLDFHRGSSGGIARSLRGFFAHLGPAAVLSSAMADLAVGGPQVRFPPVFFGIEKTNVKRYLINYPYLSDYGQTIFLSFFSVKGQSNRTRAM